MGGRFENQTLGRFSSHRTGSGVTSAQERGGSLQIQACFGSCLIVTRETVRLEHREDVPLEANWAICTTDRVADGDRSDGG